MNKLTDAEIIKAFEAHFEQEQACKSCTLQDDGDCCVTLLENACDLINRQKAEIEELRKEFTADAEYFASEYDSKIKAEAIKEFAERVKPILEKMFDLMVNDDESNCIVTHCEKPSSIPCMNELCIRENKEIWLTKIDNLVKEMVGD